MSLTAAPAAMRYTARDDLAILSAEIYPPGLAGLSYSGPTRASKKGLPVRTSDATQDGPRKRAKPQPPAPQKKDDHHGEEEEKKRTRGRPRLDVKDETAADRRRTQIRLAQRAYRNRKENAIQTLEQKVQDLKDTNEEMSNVFMQLHDFAMATGALDRNPELGRQLRITTERFLALARKASEDGSTNKDDDGGSHPSPSSHHTASPSHRISTSPEAIDIPRSEPPPLLWGGYTITHEPATPSLFLPDPPSNDFEIITQPTPENASFPFGTASFSFPSSLPPPTTYTPHESTFGRRLHRHATERALYLISMPDPPPARFHRVFGFCLLLETREAIHARTRRTVQKSIQESLAYWPYPFHNLGGAGAHGFDAPLGAGERYGNQGTVDVMKPGQTNGGFGAGPFTAGVGAARELLDGEMRMGVEGFGGEFFDPEEVELYLRIRGVVIPGGVDEVTAVVDLDGFGAVGMGSSGGGGGTASEEESSSSVDGGTMTTASSGWGFGGTSLLDPLLGGGMFSQPAAAPTTTDFMGFSTTSAAKRATVVVDVNMLISKMTDQATCLGRTPGFRREGINAAFWEAARVISS